MYILYVYDVESVTIASVKDSKKHQRVCKESPSTVKGKSKGIKRERQVISQ